MEDHWILDLYAWLHDRGYENRRLEFPGHAGEPGVAHLSIPNGPGPHPAVLVFPILAGSHVVSEGLAKALVNRGYAVVRLERTPLFPEDDPPTEMREVAARLLAGIEDGRHLLDWMEADPRLDAERLATAGVSLGGIMAATLMGIDDRVQAGFFIMAGGGLAEILFDSTERPVRAFRNRVLESLGTPDRDVFVAAARPLTLGLDPLSYAARIDPRRVVLVSGRFDRVVPPERTRTLWEGLGRPRWFRFPAGHYQLAPFFWWAVGRGADLLDRVLAPDPSGPLRALPPRRSPLTAAGGDELLEETQLLEPSANAVPGVRTGRDRPLIVIDR